MTLALTEANLPDYDPAQLVEALGASENHVELLQESVADLQMAAEDSGWQRLGFAAEQEFTRQGIAQMATNGRVMVLAAPLIRRGMQLRIGYVWGQGVTVQARAGESAAQDVNAVIQAFWDDEANQTSFTSSQAQEENERALGTDGNLCFALFTDPMTGRVQIRSVPFEEVTDKITNPGDREDVWFYLRQYDTTIIRPFRSAAGVLSTRSRPSTERMLHPAVGYRPATRPKSIDGIEVAWDAPIIHIPVNRLKGWKWGVPDVYAALPWARAYDGFLTDWAKLVKALSRFAWRLTGDKSSKARRAATAVQTATRVPVAPPLAGSLSTGGDSGLVGGLAASGPGTSLEAIPKSGATIDSESGRPLAAMVAAAMGVPVTMLLADPGTTGARAVAETLDKPTILEMGMRRALWSSVIQTVCSYVVDQAVKAPRGPLSGTVSRDRSAGGREVITLANDVERTVSVDWPDLNELDPVKLVQAIVAADSTEKMPPLETMRLLLQALGVKDVDEVIDAATDENGDWVDPLASSGDQAVQRARDGVEGEG